MTDSRLFSSRASYQEPEEYGLDDIDHSTNSMRTPLVQQQQTQRAQYRRPLLSPRTLLPHTTQTRYNYRQVPDIENGMRDDNSDESDADVPQSLMIERGGNDVVEDEPVDDGEAFGTAQQRAPALAQLPQPGQVPASNVRIFPPSLVSGDQSAGSRQRQQQQQQHMHNNMTIEEITMWKWANVENMDNFFERVYAYYVGKGIYCILLGRFLNLLSLAFVITFSTFLIGCVDISRIPSSGTHGKLWDVIDPQCVNGLSGTIRIFLFAFIVWWIWQCLRFLNDIPALRHMYNFYTYLLKIPDVDIQTVSWQQVVNRIVAISDNNPTIMSMHGRSRGAASTTSSMINSNIGGPPRLNAHDIANRIMRRENYLIALFNKDVLNLTVPLPFFRDRHMFTKDIEWNLSFCVLNFVFDDRGQVRKRFLKDVHREQLISGLRRRFIFMGILNLILTPFILVYLLILFFFRYFEEYHKNPATIGSRAFIPFARWKFREFNELPHLFQKRLNSSYEPAMKYINQFPKEKTVLMSRFVAFIAGSFAAVLALFTVADQDLLLNFEISPDRTVFFYIGLFGSVLAISRGMIPDENLVFEPEVALKDVVEQTHYLPEEWKGRLHTDEVRREFSKLFDYKISLFVEEILSVLFTPLILWFSLPLCSEQIVDFFREFTVHVDGVGYVCSFAVFDFKRHGNVKYGAPAEVDDDYYVSKEGKMEKSFLNFKANNPEWEPTDPGASLYLSRFNQLNTQPRAPQRHSMATPFGARGQPSNSKGVSTNSPSRKTAFSSPHHQQQHHVNFSTQSRPAYSDPESPSVDFGIGPSKATMASVAPVPNRYEYRYVEEEEDDDEGDQRYASELGESFAPAAERPVDTSVAVGRGGGLGDSSEADRNQGVYGLLNQFYELNNPKI